MSKDQKNISEQKLDVIIYLLISLLRNDKELDQDISQRLAKFLNSYGYTQDEIAQMLNMGKQTVNKILK